MVKQAAKSSSKPAATGASGERGGRKVGKAAVKPPRTSPGARTASATAVGSGGGAKSASTKSAPSKSRPAEKSPAKPAAKATSGKAAGTAPPTGASKTGASKAGASKTSPSASKGTAKQPTKPTAVKTSAAKAAPAKASAKATPTGKPSASKPTQASNATGKAGGKTPASPPKSAAKQASKASAKRPTAAAGSKPAKVGPAAAAMPPGKAGKAAALGDGKAAAAPAAAKSAPKPAVSRASGSRGPNLSKAGAGRSVAAAAVAVQQTDSQGYVLINGRRVRMISTKDITLAKKPKSSESRFPAEPTTVDVSHVKTRLSRKELDHYRDLLVTRRAEILGLVRGMEQEALRGEGGNLSHMPIHMADIGSDTADQDFALNLAEKERETLAEIDAALARIEDGSYGVCQATGKPIPKARLDAKPWAKYTIEAARMVESGHRF